MEAADTGLGCSILYHFLLHVEGAQQSLRSRGLSVDLVGNLGAFKGGDG